MFNTDVVESPLFSNAKAERLEPRLPDDPTPEPDFPVEEIPFLDEARSVDRVFASELLACGPVNLEVIGAELGALGYANAQYMMMQGIATVGLPCNGFWAIAFGVAEWLIDDVLPGIWDNLPGGLQQFLILMGWIAGVFILDWILDNLGLEDIQDIMDWLMDNLPSLASSQSQPASYDVLGPIAQSILLDEISVLPS